MNRFTKWQTWLAVFALGAVGLFSGCSDSPPDLPMELQTNLSVIGTPSQNYWQQCQNNHDYDGPCKWVTSVLNSTHNTWAEGDWVPKLLRVINVTDNAPFDITMSYGFLKGGHTTHDFLGIWNLTQAGADPCVDKYFEPFCSGGAGTFPTTGFVASNNMAGLTQNAVDDKCTTAMSDDMAEAIAAAGVGNLVIEGLNVETIEVTNMYLDKCPVGGDAEMWVEMTVTPTNDATGPEGLLLLMSAHVARGENPAGPLFGDWDNGGAGDVTGAPYHLGLKFLDGESTGSMDLQMNANAVYIPQPSASITITPDGTNRVGDTHTFTATVEASPDVGEPFAPAPDGTVIDFNIESGPGALSSPSCTTSGGIGSCSVDLTSDATGVTVVSASSSVTVGYFTLPISTNGVAPNSGPATKTWVNAKIAIDPPEALNPVGELHTFTVTVMKDLGDGGSWIPAAGENVTATQAGTLADVTLGGTCTTGMTDSNGQCTFTYTSATAGTLILTAHSTLAVSGVPIALSTDGTGYNSGPATKAWGGAWITIGTDGTNEAGVDHTFTVTVMREVGSDPAEPVEGVTVTPTGETDFVDGGTCTTGTTDTNGQCTIIVSSAVADQATIGASADVPLNGSSIPVSTDGVAPNSGDATKTWVDAKIAIDPPEALNPVGELHTFTVTVMEDLGDGGGWVPAAGEDVTATQAGTLAGVTLGGTCTTGVTDSNGQCTFTYNSATAGTLILTASSDVDVGGITLTRTTNGNDPNSGPATKTWGRAWITIGADGTNEVGVDHTFTVKVMREVGSDPAEPVGGVTVTPTGETGFVTGGTCTTGTTDPNGECTIIVSSAVADQATIGASADVPLNGSSIPVSTDGVAPNSEDATKTWVDAKIQIAQDGTNPVGVPHTFTVTVWENEGLGGGWVKASGESVLPEQVGTGPGNFDTESGCFVNLTDSNGQCTVTVNSEFAGTFEVKATSDVQVGGLSLTRSTNGVAPNSDTATKTWVDAQISILGSATNEVGTTHTFTVKVEENAGAGFVAASGETVSGAIIANLFGATSTITGGTCTGPTDTNGECTIEISSSTTGQTIIGAASTVQVSGIGVATGIVSTDANLNTRAATGPGIKDWVDAYITIAADATNFVGDPHTFTVTVWEDTGDGSGFVPAVGETVTNSTSGTAGSITGGSCTTGTTDTNGQCTIIVNSSVPGFITVTASSDVGVGGITVTRTTDGTAPNSGPATKTWIPEAETAWAATCLETAGQPTCVGQLPYPGSNWATYVDFRDVGVAREKIVTLFAGQTIDVGTVEIRRINANDVTITINLVGWEFDESSANLMVQDYFDAPTGPEHSNPSPGQFEWKETATGMMGTITVDHNNYYGIHAVVVEMTP